MGLVDEGLWLEEQYSSEFIASNIKRSYGDTPDGDL